MPALTGAAAQAQPDPETARLDAVLSDYAALLTEIVTEEGLVRYSLLEATARRAKLQAVLDSFGKPTSFENDHARIAFLCNAYNANVLEMALQASRKPGFRSVKDTPGFFDTQTIVVAGETFTLNKLEDRIRGFGDPRIHAALVCGARSCPSLRSTPYTGRQLGAQLDDQALRWLEDQSKNRAARDGLLVSEIFKWYEEDFNVAPYNDVRGFIRKHSRPSGVIREFMRSVPNLKIEHLPYDWRLNSAASSP